MSGSGISGETVRLLSLLQHVLRRQRMPATAGTAERRRRLWGAQTLLRTSFSALRRAPPTAQWQLTQ